MSERRRARLSISGVVVSGLILVGSLSGCSFGGTSFQSPEQRPRPESQEEVTAKQAPPVELRALKSSGDALSAIEVVWEVPAEPVEGFIVRYGDAHEALTVERRLAIAEIERVSDPARGRLYRYVIEGIPTTRRVFLTIAAFNGAHESPPSKVFEVFPGEPE